MKLVSYSMLVILIAFGCKPKQAPQEEQQIVSTAAPVDKIVAIGKVEPLNGIVELASEAGGIIQEVLKKDGDEVEKGEVIVILSHAKEQLQATQIEFQLKAAQQQVAANQTTIQENETRLNQTLKLLTASKKLAAIGGETVEKVEQLEMDKKVLEIQLQKSKAIVGEGQAKVQELTTQLALANKELETKTIKAPSKGRILQMNARKGEALEAMESVASFAPDEAVVVHGEADELFAHQLKVGQKVDVHAIGNDAVIATGKVVALSYSLNNKSLFSDEPGEQQDRRVRRFKVEIGQSDQLLFNTKVACDIYVK